GPAPGRARAGSRRARLRTEDPARGGEPEPGVRTGVRRLPPPLVGACALGDVSRDRLRAPPATCSGRSRRVDCALRAPQRPSTQRRSVPGRRARGPGRRMSPMRQPRFVLAALVVLAAAPSVAHADEGMWTFDNLPVERLRQAYGFTATPEWLE